MKKPKFEDCLPAIDQEIAKRRSKWRLEAIAWMDFDDVAQLIRIHIHKKWYQYDPKQPLLHWVNRIISHQIRNIMRDVYRNYCRPCIKCAAAEGDDLCQIYGKQCNLCPLYAKWERHKKVAYNIKLPTSLDKIIGVTDAVQDPIDVESTIDNVHELMKKRLDKTEWKFYQALYIQNKTEEEFSKECGFKTTEKGRKAGYRHIFDLKNRVMGKVKDALYNNEVDFVML